MNLRRSRYYIVLLFCILVLPFSAHAQSKSDIVTLQTFLEQKGFLVIPPGDVKGNFGPKTKAALIEYQKSVGLPAEGVYGPQTKAKMKGDTVSPAVFPDIQPTASKPTEPSQSFVTETQLQKAIDALKQSLIVKSIGNSSVTPQTNFAAIALSQKIDQLTNTTLTTPVITGGSMTNTNISGGTMTGVSFSGASSFSGGNVGIGTENPIAPLHVTGNAQFLDGTTYYSQYVTQNGANNGVFLGYDTSGTIGVLGANGDGGTGSNLAFWTVNTGGLWSEKMRITRNGNVGIGTTSPASKLDVAGSIDVGSGQSSAVLRFRNGVSKYFTVTSNDTAIDFQSYGATPLRFQDQGGSAVSFGTNVTISGTILNLGGGTSDGLVIGSASGVTGKTIQSYGGHALYLNLLANNVDIGNGDLFVNNSTGNVGIGSTTPMDKFTVVGGDISVSRDQYLRFRSSASSVQSAAIGGTGTNDLAFYSNGLAEGMRLTSGGNLGIGTTTPSSRLDVYGPQSGIGALFYGGATLDSSRRSGQIAVGDDASSRGQIGYGYGSGDMYIDNTYASATGDIYFRTQTSGTPVNALSILGGGNVGIGTTTPGAKLDVFKGDPGTGSVAANAFSTAVFSNSTHNYLTILSPNNRTGVVAFGDPQDAVKGQIGYDHSADQLFMTINGTGNTAVYTSAGNFGIGTTSPQSRLHLNTGATSQYIQLTADAAGSLATDGLQIGILNSGVDASLWNLENGYMRFATNNTERVRITSAGNVGIATTSPWRSLAVTGTVGFDGLTAGAGAGSLCLSANKEVTYSAGATCTVSSGRFKYDIFTASTGLEFVNKLRPVTFKYNSDIGVPGEQFGFIAEEVEALDPRLVVHDAEGLPFSVRYENLTAVLARAIQELSSQISSIGAWFVGGKFHVQNDVCVDDVCINKEQFKQMLLGAGGAASSVLEPLVLTTSPSPEVATTSEEVVSDVEEVTALTPTEELPGE